MIPFLSDEKYSDGEIIIVQGVKTAIENGETSFAAKAVAGDKVRDITLRIDPLTADERDIIADGCLMNYYKKRNNG